VTESLRCNGERTDDPDHSGFAEHHTAGYLSGAGRPRLPEPEAWAAVVSSHLSLNLARSSLHCVVGPEFYLDGLSRGQASPCPRHPGRSVVPMAPLSRTGVGLGKAKNNALETTYARPVCH